MLYLIWYPVISRQVGFGYAKGQVDPDDQYFDKWSCVVHDSTSHTIVNFNTATLSCLCTRKAVMIGYTDIYYSDQIEKNEAGRACSMYGRGQRYIQCFGGET